MSDPQFGSCLLGRCERVDDGAIIDYLDLGFLLPDLAAAVESARAAYVDVARRTDAERQYNRKASIVDVADAAMAVTADAVQVLGGAG